MSEVSTGPTLPSMMPRFSEIIHANLSVILTYAFSYCSLDKMLDRFQGEWKFLRKSIVEKGTVRATQACIELAVSLRSLNEQEDIFPYDDQVGKIELGFATMKDQTKIPLGVREFTNKIIHAKDLSWDFSDPSRPKLICSPKNPEGWVRADIGIVEVAAYCGSLMH